MTRLRLLAVVVVLAILTISTGVVVAAPPQQAPAPDVTFSPTSVTVMEPGGTDTYTVVYDTALTADVIMTVTSRHPMINATVDPAVSHVHASRLEHTADSDCDCRRRPRRPRS